LCPQTKKNTKKQKRNCSFKNETNKHKHALYMSWSSSGVSSPKVVSLPGLKMPTHDTTVQEWWLQSTPHDNRTWQPAMASGEANTCKCGPLRFTIVTTNPEPGTTARLDGNDGKGTSTMAKVSPKTNQPLLFVLIFFLEGKTSKKVDYADDTF
jgi:hypothetical protein